MSAVDFIAKHNAEARAYGKRLDLDDGKYTIIFNRDGAALCLRDNEVWRELQAPMDEPVNIVIRWLADSIVAHSQNDFGRAEALHEAGLKYTIALNEEGLPDALLRYGNYWADLHEDDLVRALLAAFEQVGPLVFCAPEKLASDLIADLGNERYTVNGDRVSNYFVLAEHVATKAKAQVALIEETVEIPPEEYGYLVHFVDDISCQNCRNVPTEHLSKAELIRVLEDLAANVKETYERGG